MEGQKKIRKLWRQQVELERKSKRDIDRTRQNDSELTSESMEITEISQNAVNMNEIENAETSEMNIPDEGKEDNDNIYIHSNFLFYTDCNF